MKKLFTFILALLMLSMLFSSCERSADGDSNNSSDTQNHIGADTINNIIESYPARYIRTGWNSDEGYPYTRVISTIEDFLSYKENVFSYTLGYDEAYFEDRALLIAVLSEGSGSVRHDFKGIGEDGTVYIDRIVPEVGTCDMASWNIVIEIPKDIASKNFTIETSDKYPAERISYGEGYTYISSMIPEGWDSEIVLSTDFGDNFSIRLYPYGEPDNSVTVSYNDSFGLCETGLESAEVTIGEYEVIKHKYDGSHRTIYTFNNLPGKYVVEVSSDIAKNYADTVEDILLSLEFAPDWIIRESEAIKIAEKEINIKCEYKTAAFNSENGNWTVNFRESGKTTDDNHTVVMDWSGKIISVD